MEMDPDKVSLTEAVGKYVGISETGKMSAKRLIAIGREALEEAE